MRALSVALAVVIVSLSVRPAAAVVTLVDATPLVGIDGQCSFPAVFILGSGLCPSLKEGVTDASDVSLDDGSTSHV